MDNLNKLVNTLAQQIPKQAMVNTSVSKTSVGWHIEHCLLIINQVIEALENSNPEAYKRTFDVRRNLVMFFGIIPRGKVKTPKRVQPQNDINEDLLTQHIAVTEKKLAVLNQLQPNKYFHHPFLGDFKLKPAVRFLAVHTNHHLKIIKDIVSKQASTIKSLHT